MAMRLMIIFQLEHRTVKIVLDIVNRLFNGALDITGMLLHSIRIKNT